MFKKLFFLISLSTTFLLFSYEQEKVYAEVEVDFEYTYTFNGVPIDSNVELSEDQLQFLFSGSQNTDETNYGLISPFNIDGGGNSGTIIDGPYKKTISAADSRLIVSLGAVWLGDKLGKYIPHIKTIAYSLAGATWFVTENQVDRYIGSWVWKAYDTSGYTPIMKKYITVVEYNTSDFLANSVKKITVQDVGYY